MYRDKTLLPNEAIRLMALGLLAEQPISYGDLAAEVRHFTGRIAGPSLELVGAPLEVLIVEGLAEAKGAAEQAAEHQDDAILNITENGRGELLELLSSNTRAPANELSKLVIAIKIRFLHLLPKDGQILQAEMLLEISERELARLTDLRRTHESTGGHMQAWLDQEIAQVQARQGWYQKLLEQLSKS